MRILFTVQLVFAVGLLLFGVIGVFGLGITGLLFLLPGFVFIAIAAAIKQGARFGVALGLAVDALLAWWMLQWLANAGAGAKLLDVLPPTIVLLLIAVGAVATLADWRSVRSAAWF